MNRRVRALGALLERHGVQPVGDGFLDCICPREEAEPFLRGLRSLGVAVSGYSLWQYAASEEEPVCGMGGPRCRYREGWYSELQGGLYTFRSLREMERLLDEEENRLQCTLSPGFWLVVPEDGRCV